MKFEELMIGSLLGDGCITKDYQYSFRYIEAHSFRQKDYLLWKNKVFNFHFKEYQKKPKVKERINKLARENYQKRRKKTNTLQK